MKGRLATMSSAITTPSLNLAADIENIRDSGLGVVSHKGVVRRGVRFAHQHGDVVAHRLGRQITKIRSAATLKERILP